MLSVICIAFAFAFISRITALQQIKSAQAELQVKLDAAQKKNAHLQQEKADLQDPQYIEKIARNELGMTKKGEMPYVSNVKNDD